MSTLPPPATFLYLSVFDISHRKQLLLVMLDGGTMEEGAFSSCYNVQLSSQDPIIHMLPHYVKIT